MMAPSVLTDQHRLFGLNRSRPMAAVVAEIEQIEGQWIVPLAAALVTDPTAPTDCESLLLSLEDLLAEPPGRPESVRFVGEECGLDAFRMLVAEFAVIGLTETESFLPIVSRLPDEARLAVLRMLTDEFGCGNPARSHSCLYRELLDELGLSTVVEDHVPQAAPETLALANLFYWLAARAEGPSWFLGAMAQLAASFMLGFDCYIQACDRLPVLCHDYYRERVNLGVFHRHEMHTALALLNSEGSLDTAAAWAGALLSAEMFGAAFEVAVTRTRSAVCHTAAR